MEASEGLGAINDEVAYDGIARDSRSSLPKSRSPVERMDSGPVLVADWVLDGLHVSDGYLKIRSLKMSSTGGRPVRCSRFLRAFSNPSVFLSAQQFLANRYAAFDLSPV